MTKDQLKSEISEMEAVLNDASTPADTKEVLREAVKNAKEQLREMEQQEEVQKKEEKQLEAKAEGIKKDMTKAKTPEAKKKLSTTLEKAKQQLSKKKEEGKQKKKKAESKLSQQVAKAKGILKKASAKSQKFNAGRSQDNLERDSKRKAKPIGWRTSAEGNRYWEGRANRSDVDRRKMPYLEHGGLINPVDADPLKVASELYANGGRLKSAINRDRAYKSEEPWEQDYNRKTKPKNPKYRYEHGGELKAVAENINVFGYQTEYFSLCPKAVEQFEKAINAFELERDMESGYWKIQTESLSMCAKNADAIIGLHQRAAKGEGIDTVDVKMMVNSLQYFAIFNYKSGLKINGDFLENHVEGMFSHKIMFEFGGAILPLTNGTLSDPRFNIDSSQFYEAGGNILNEDTVGRVENMELADPAAYEKGGRIKEMVNHWNKYGWAGSSTDNDDSEFFKMIGRTQFDTPVTSFTGNDVKYYDDERVMPVSGGFRKFDNGGEVDDYAYAKTRGFMEQDWEQLAIDFYGKHNWDKLSEAEKNSVIADVQRQWQRQYMAYAKGGQVGDTNGIKDEMLRQKIEIFLKKLESHRLLYYYVDPVSNSLYVGFDKDFTQKDADAVSKFASESREFFDADDVEMQYFPKTETTQYSIKLKRVVEYAKGGEVVLLQKNQTDQKHYKRYSGAIGYFEWTYKDGKLKRYNWAILYPLDDFDNEYYSHIKLKDGEQLFRYWTDVIFDKKERHLVKINIKKSLIYFMKNSEDDKNPEFETAGIKADVLMIERDNVSQNIFKNWYGMGGKTTFEDKVKAISGNLEGKKVKPKYQRKYGKRYSHKEAVEAARNIAGSMRKKEMK